VLYSDGLIERRSGDLDKDMAALVEAAGGLAGGTAEQACAALVERLVPAAGNEDDVCLLVLEVPPGRRWRPVSSLMARETAGRPYC
jgi:serine phosphatase RsbU (regulator of sigma subunit)